MATNELVVIDFYGLESGRPEFWSDMSANNQSQLNLASPSTLDSSTMSPEVETVAQPPPLLSVPASNLPITDPLGIVSSKKRHQDRNNNAASNTGVKNQSRRRKDLAAESIVSPSFDAKRFLLAQYRSTSYEDLRRGLRNLELSVQSRTETMKGLVKENFDRFVSAKSTVDQVYRELKSKNLNSAGYGTDQFTQALGESFQQSNQLFSPIIQRKVKADKIRSTLAVLDRYKFVFNLPRSIEESMKKANYDQAVRDYRKGKSIMSGNNVLDMQQSPTSAYLPLSAINNNDQIPPQHQLQSPAISLARNAGLQKCFNKVWVEVDRAVAKLRQVLFKELGQHYRQSAATSSDQQEKLVSYLIELDSPEDPVWFLVCSQYKALLHSLRASYEEMLTQVEKYSLQIGTNTTTTEETTAERLQRQIDAIRFKNELESFFSEEYLLLFNGDAEFHCWAAIKKMVLFASEFLSHNVVDFWKLCLAYREGRFAIQGVSVAASSKADRQVATAAITSTNSTDKQSRRKQEATALPPQAPAADKCLLMLSQITNAVVFPVATALRFILQGSPDGERLLNSVHMRDLDIFTALADYSDNSTLSEADEQRSSVTITAANSDSSGFNQNMARHLVGCCQFLPGLLNGLTSAAREFHRSIQAVSGGANADLFDEMTRPVQELISALQSAAIQRLLDGWKCESSLFYRHEDWALGDGECSSSVRLFGKLQKSLLRSAFMLSTQTEFDSSLLRAEFEAFTQRRIAIPSAISDSVKQVFFDTFYSLLDCWQFTTFDDQAWFHWTLANYKHLASHLTAAASVSTGPSQLDNRILIALVNLEYARSTLIPDTVSALERLFNLQTLTECEELMQTVGRLDNLLFETFIERKSLTLCEICRRGILLNGYDWASNDHPTAVHGYVNEMLLQLVLTQAEVGAVIRKRVNNNQLIDRLLGALVKVIILALLDCFRHIDMFGRGGAKQAAVDIGAVTTALDSYLNQSVECEALSRLALRYIEDNTADEEVDDRNDASMVADLVLKWRKSSQMQFMSLKTK